MRLLDRLTRPLKTRHGLLAFLAGALVFAAAGALALLLPESERARPERPRPRIVLPPFDFGGGPEVHPGGVRRAAPPRSLEGLRPVPGQLIVKFKAGTPQDVIDATLASVGADAKRKLKIGPRVLEVARERAVEVLAALETSPAVEYAERDVLVEQLDTIPNDALWSTQWGLVNVSATTAWDAARGSSSVVVAVLDTGLDAGHPDLQGALVPGFDFVNNDGDPSDDQGHGTAAAGVIAARTNNVQGQAGTCWDCSLMPVKVLDSTGSGTTSWVASGIVWAVDHGADVISMSLGGPGATQTLADAVSYAAAKGATLIAAAGNSGSSTQFYPAAYTEVISVAGTTTSDQLYGWSNYGPWVKVAAPGCNTAPSRGGGYVNFCGTSSATPIVSGLAGLALTVNPQATRTDIELAIRSAAVQIGGSVQWGRVNAAGTLAALGASLPSSRAAPRSEESVKGTIRSGDLSQSYTRSVGRGRTTARLTFKGGRSLTLAIVTRSGRTIARISGRSGLRLARTLSAGTYRFVVRGSGSTRVAFTLTLAHPAR